MRTDSLIWLCRLQTTLSWYQIAYSSNTSSRRRVHGIDCEVAHGVVQFIFHVCSFLNSRVRETHGIISWCGEPRLCLQSVVHVLLISLMDPQWLLPLQLRWKKADKTKEEQENPAYVQWVAHDQQLLGYLLSSMTKEILVQVSSLEHASEVWTAVSQMFASQSNRGFCS